MPRLFICKVGPVVSLSKGRRERGVSAQAQHRDRRQCPLLLSSVVPSVGTMTRDYYQNTILSIIWKAGVSGVLRQGLRLGEDTTKGGRVATRCPSSSDWFPPELSYSLVRQRWRLWLPGLRQHCQDPGTASQVSGEDILQVYAGEYCQSFRN